MNIFLTERDQMNMNNQNLIYTFALIEPVKLIIKIAGTTLTVTKSTRHN
jgi:hypothetical protein